MLQGPVTRAKENWNFLDKTWNSLEHGPHEIEERLRPFTPCVVDIGTDIAS